MAMVEVQEGIGIPTVMDGVVHHETKERKDGIGAGFVEDGILSSNFLIMAKRDQARKGGLGAELVGFGLPLPRIGDLGTTARGSCSCGKFPWPTTQFSRKRNGCSRPMG